MPFKLKKFILLSLLFYFDVAESQTIQEMYTNARRNENHYLMSNEICNYPITHLPTACGIVYRFVNQFFPYKDQNKLLHLSYQAFIPKYLECKLREVKFNVYSRETFQQFMIACPGRHNPVHTDINLDSYVDEIYISYGYEQNHAMIYMKIKNWDPRQDYYIPKYHVRLSWGILLPIPVEHLNNVMPNSFELSFIEDTYEVQRLYVRDKLYNMSVDSIFQSEISQRILFNLCTTIIESTCLRDVIGMQDEDTFLQLDRLLDTGTSFEDVVRPFTTHLQSEDYVVHTPEVHDYGHKYTVMKLYKIPGSLNDDAYRISSTSRSKSLLFYEYENGLYKPILLVQNVYLLEHSDGSIMNRTYNEESDTEAGN